MKYQKLSIKQLREYKYPNLIAELIESGYSICTLSEYMGLGNRREQNDTEIWDKLCGKAEILSDEAKGLTDLFGVKFEYLFSYELKTLCNKSAAYWRWYDWNKKMQEEYERNKEVEQIQRELKDKPYLIEFMKEAITWSKEELQQVIEYLENRNNTKTA